MFHKNPPVLKFCYFKHIYTSQEAVLLLRENIRATGLLQVEVENLKRIVSRPVNIISIVGMFQTKEKDDEIDKLLKENLMLRRKNASMMNLLR